MTAARILDGLDRLDLAGDEAVAAARLGFLEWVFTQPGSVSACEARAALDGLRGQTPASDAAHAFLGYLREACGTGAHPAVRRRGEAGRPARLH